MAYSPHGAPKEEDVVAISKEFMSSHAKDYQYKCSISPEAYDSDHIKRGLRNSDGTGVIVGVTQIGNVKSCRRASRRT